MASLIVNRLVQMVITLFVVSPRRILHGTVTG